MSKQKQSDEIRQDSDLIVNEAENIPDILDAEVPGDPISQEAADISESLPPAESDPNASENTPLLVSRTAQERQEARNIAQAGRDKRQDDANIISNFLLASKNGNVLRAMISGIHADENNVSWVCYVGPITIHIPFRESFPDLPAALLDPSTPSLQVRRSQFLQKSIGVEIPFVVTNFTANPNAKQGEYIAIASRVKALSRIRKRYYGPEAINPDKAGNTVQAQVLTVGTRALVLSFHGVDLRVENRVLSHRYYPDLTAIYAAGDTVTVKIMGIATDPETGDPVVSVSGRAVEVDEAKKNYHRVKEGDIYAATVVSMRTNPSLQFYLWLEGIEVPGYAATKTLKDASFVHSGDKVYVKVLGITKSGYVHTKIVRKAGRQ